MKTMLLDAGSYRLQLAEIPLPTSSRKCRRSEWMPPSFLHQSVPWLHKRYATPQKVVAWYVQASI